MPPQAGGVVLNCYVCVKQVPDTAAIRLDPVHHTLIREGVRAILNPYDAFALETALRLKDAEGGTVTVLSMGPPQAKEMLKGCLAAGADAAFLASDPRFGGSDTLATSYILSLAVKKAARRTGCAPDLILCGRQAVDGDTGQVGPALAELLALPQITNARELYCRAGILHAERVLTDAAETVACRLPALVTLSATPYALRPATVRGRLAAQKKEIAVLDFAALAPAPERCGLAGSPTRVAATAVPEEHSRCAMLTGADAAGSAAALLGVLGRAGVLPGEESDDAE